MALVTDQQILSNHSIQDNIAYGMSSVTHDAILNAAKNSNVTEFIDKLSGGYATKIASLTQLSAGQRLRISIARALIRDPPILLLDDTSTENDDLVNKALEYVTKNRSCIVITNRLKTLIMANRIVVLHNGRSVEQGTHLELLALKGHYYRLFFSASV